MLAALLALAAAHAAEPCLPDGGVERFEPLPDRAALDARFGPTIAGLAAAWHGATWRSQWSMAVSVWPRDGQPKLPTELRVPVPAPAPLEARAIVALGERSCLPLEVRSERGAGSVSIGVALPARIEVTWGGRVVETTDLGASDGLAVAWGPDGGMIAVYDACPPAPLVGTVTDVPFAHCFGGAWKTALARGKWPAAERAAIVALLARTSFGDLPFDAGLALVARTDLTPAERATLGVPARGRAEGEASFVLGEALARPRVAVNGVPATRWREDGTLALPAVGRATVTIEHPSFKQGGAPWSRGVETWLADGAAFAAHPAWGPVITAQKEAPRCGLVPADTPGAWACGDRPVTPGTPFPIPCARPAANGDLAWVTVGDGDARRGVSLLPAAPGTYTFREIGGAVTFERTAATCP